jgi:hypothetical protein
MLDGLVKNENSFGTILQEFDPLTLRHNICRRLLVVCGMSYLYIVNDQISRVCKRSVF